MRLRRQLLIVSLFVLSLPWAGCQYIRQMEAALRDGQARALTATARAVAARLEAEAERIDLPQHPAVYNFQQQFYLHPLRSEAIVDGYDAEWLALDIAGIRYQDPQWDRPRVTSYGGWFEDNLYLFFAVEDASPLAHHPQQGGIANGDHLVLRALQDRFALREYVFRAGGNGTVIARYLNDSGDIRQEHRIRGEWRETGGGYELELRVPAHLAAMGMDFYYVDARPGEDPLRIGNYNPIDYPAPWVRPSGELSQVLEPYTDDSLRIWVLNPHQWLLAQAGRLSARRADEDQVSPWLAWLYRAALGRQDFLPLEDPRFSGRMASPEAQAAFAEGVGVAWYQQGTQRVGRVVVPLSRDDRVVGAVAVEQSTDTLLAETNTAFNQLFLYTVLATGFAGFGLLAYASWLSWRIRRLNRAADTAIGEDGKIRPDFLQSRASDEIGDLTRSYARLLSRLRDYTDYLRSLSSKLSHELRTPLAVMKSSLDNLDHEPLSPGANTYIQRAREASQRLSTILNAMSSANRMEESIQQAQTEVFPLDELLRNLTEAYRETYRGCRLELDIAKGEQGWQLEGSPDLLVQMLDKLVDNAADFCPPQGKITLALAREGRSLRLSVANEGPLLPEHMQGQLFDSLVSLRDKPGSDDKTHLGLGLFIVRLIVDFHRGRVSARNLADESGVVFEVWLPSGE